MRLLLDTHLLLWWLADDPALSERARKLIRNPSNEVHVSAVSAWEIEIKRALGKLFFDGEVGDAVRVEGFVPLPIDFHHTAELGRLPPIHQDPFDRLLISQARFEQLQILTVDKAILKYPVNALDCG